MLARVALIALGALLLVFTGYLVVQVNAGPNAEVAAMAPPVHAGRAAAPAEGQELGATPDEMAAGDERSARAERTARATNIPPPVDPLTPISLSSFGTGATGSANTNTNAAGVSAAANLQLDEANKLYDRRDYEEARILALSILKDNPTSARMRRIVVASSCIMGDHDVAQQHYLMLPEKDRGDMRVRCVPYGSAFHE